MLYSDLPLIDSRDRTALRKRVSELAASFTPEWGFDTEHPDTGSTLALIFINQISDNIRRLNQLPDKYRTEFANLLGVSLLPAYPASGIIVAQLASDTVSGVPLAHGTKLLGQASNGDPVIFETLRDIYVTSSILTDLVSIFSKKGKIIPIMNGPKPACIFSQISEDEESFEAESEVPLFSLFDSDGDGIEQNALVLYHKSIFDGIEGLSILIKPVSADGSPLSERLSDPLKYRWLRNSSEGAVPLDSVSAVGDCIVLTQREKSEPVRLDGEDLFGICLESLEPVKEPLVLSDLRICAICDETAPEFVLHNSDELEIPRFLPFGESASLFDECYIGHDRLFAQQGANVRLSFSLSSVEKLVTFTPQQEAAELKIIKRKPKAVLFDTVTTSPQSVLVEYYNGLGWKRLSCESDFSTLFNGINSGNFEIGFTCPDDWQPITMGGFCSRMFRFRISQADNCYLQPCIHKMPIISNLKISCTYDKIWKQPQRLRRICGTLTEDLTDRLLSHLPFPAFSPLSYGLDALYFGFDEKPDGAPISLLFETVESVLPGDCPPAFEYSTKNGFKSLKAIDGTKGLSRSGTIMFIPPTDFSAFSVEGLTRFWLRLVDLGEATGKAPRFCPQIKRLLLNAAEVRNCETLEEEAFYIESSIPNMTFPLAAETIYTTHVFVSEMPSFSPSSMEQMAQLTPDRVRITHDFLGNITSFFVLWDEVESFDSSTPSDRHYVIDRMNNSISFGDGVHVAIPPAQDGVAFTVQSICCKGQGGNLPAGAVNTLFDSTLYLGGISNPIPTYGGSDLETVSCAQQRGSWIVSGRNRLVCGKDFEREVLAFSDSIEKVRCVAGIDICGRPSPGLITIAIMSRAFEEGAYSFTGLHDSLKARLLSRCEATVTDDTLCLSEPSFVSISIDVWIQIENVAHYFDAQTLIYKRISEFISPLQSELNGGWDIGVLPTDNQLHQMLHSIGFKGYVTRFIATARYVDESGSHETDLKHLPANPFAIAVNGTHRVFLELENRR